MREIKFRAWDSNTKKIVYTGEKPKWNSGNEITNGDLLDWFEDEDLMQFTGLKDKNGKEIYEGDLVNAKFNEGTVCEHRPIIYSENNHAFVVDNGKFHESLSGIVEMKVIGNVWENPLEEKC